MKRYQKEPNSRVMTLPLEGVPLPNIENLRDYEKGFWEGARYNELRIQQCGYCQKFRHTPTPMCPFCNSLEYSWTAVSGNGKVYSFVIAYHAVHPALLEKEQTPYNICLIELDEQEGLRMVSNVLNAAPEDLYIDMPVKVTFMPTVNDLMVVLPMFVPVTDESSY